MLRVPTIYCRNQELFFEKRGSLPLEKALLDKNHELGIKLIFCDPISKLIDNIGDVDKFAGFHILDFANITTEAKGLYEGANTVMYFSGHFESSGYFSLCATIDRFLELRSFRQLVVVSDSLKVLGRLRLQYFLDVFQIRPSLVSNTSSFTEFAKCSPLLSVNVFLQAPSFYLECNCCLHSALPAMHSFLLALLYSLILEGGRKLNLRDLFIAYESIIPIKEAPMQVFIRSFSELLFVCSGLKVRNSRNGSASLYAPNLFKLSQL